jgi:xylulose-5-phosphate/fructose-6-phosphate phosphoketolase
MIRPTKTRQNTFLSTAAHCLRSKNYVNLMVGSKQPVPSFLSTSEAEKHCQAGASIWKFASTDNGLNPDVVLVGIGSELTFEVVCAASILRRLCPALRVRVVNVTDLMILESESAHPHSLTDQEFEALFTGERGVHFNYHGYGMEIQGLLFGRRGLGEGRVSVGCYREEGSTTTPFDMMLRNGVSRYHVMEAAIRGAARCNEKVALEMTSLLAEVRHQITKVQQYIYEAGNGMLFLSQTSRRCLGCVLSILSDPEGTFEIPRFEGTVFDKGSSGKGEAGLKEDGFFVN